MFKFKIYKRDLQFQQWGHDYCPAKIHSSKSEILWQLTHAAFGQVFKHNAQKRHNDPNKLGLAFRKLSS